MRARELMSSNPACCTPDDQVRDAARMMADWDCGIIPVVEDKQTMRLVGVVTDRDLAVRGLAQGKGADAKVRELMTASLAVVGAAAAPNARAKRRRRGFARSRAGARPGVTAPAA